MQYDRISVLRVGAETCYLWADARGLGFAHAPSAAARGLCLVRGDVCHLWAENCAVCASVSVSRVYGAHTCMLVGGYAPQEVAGGQWHDERLGGGPGPHRQDAPGPDHQPPSPSPPPTDLRGILGSGAAPTAAAAGKRRGGGAGSGGATGCVPPHLLGTGLC